MLHRNGIGLLLFTGLIVLTADAGERDLRLHCSAGDLSVTDSSGGALWRVRLAQDRPATSVTWDGESGVLDNGLVFDRFGRLTGKLSTTPSATLFAPGALPDDRATADWPDPAWDPLFEIAPVPSPDVADYSNAPMFDSAGDAWVVLTHWEGTHTDLQLRKSIGHSGDWGPVQTIHSGTSYILGTESVMDKDENITVVFREGGYHLKALRYTPTGGWGPAQELYGTSDFFQAIEVGADQAGNVAVIFDLSPADWPGAWTVIRNAATGAWSTAQRVSPLGYKVLLPTILSNPATDTMYLVYLVTQGGPVGLYAHRFDSATCTWGPAEFLPGSESAWFSTAGNESRFPGVVDDAGNLTLFWGSPYVPHASRNIGGAWQPPVQLASYETADVENFGGTAFNTAGDVFGVFSRYDGLSRFCAFRYDAGQGWQPAESPYAFSTIYQTRVRVAFYQGRRAVGTMLGVQSGIRQIVSFLFDGANWVPGVLDVPDTYQSFFTDLVPQHGETLMVFEVETIDFIVQGIRATWLRAPNLGDMNCDLAINGYDIDPFVLALTDPAGYAAEYPECYGLNADCNSDGLVNGYDIDPFVALLLAK
jgi:hypothetical protein